MKKRGVLNAASGKIKTETCLQCGEEIQNGYQHCEGSKSAYGCLKMNPHHGSVLWEPCWKCGATMGCSDCVSGKRDHGTGRHYCDELICKPCRVKANQESFLNGGPLSAFTMTFGNKKILFCKIQKHTPDIGEYPFEYRAKYAAQRARFGQPLDVSDEQVFREFRKRLDDLISGMEIPKELSRRQRQAERNRQVAQLPGVEK